MVLRWYALELWKVVCGRSTAREVGGVGGDRWGLGRVVEDGGEEETIDRRRMRLWSVHLWRMLRWFVLVVIGFRLCSIK